MGILPFFVSAFHVGIIHRERGRVSSAEADRSVSRVHDAQGLGDGGDDVGGADGVDGRGLQWRGPAAGLLDLQPQRAALVDDEQVGQPGALVRAAVELHDERSTVEQGAADGGDGVGLSGHGQSSW